MSFSRYLKANAGEFFLVALSAWSVGVVGANAFFLDGMKESLGYAGRAGLVGVLVCILVAALYAAAFNRKRLAMGATCCIALAAVVVAVSLALSTGENVYEDAEGNYLYFALTAIAAAFAGFLLTRTLAGSAIWFVASAFVCSTVQAFYQSEEVVLSTVASLAALALVVHRNFRLGLVSADVARAPRHGRNFAVSVAAVACAGAMALIAWFALIAPLDPATAEIKLVTDYRRLPIEEYKGTADEQPTFDYGITTDQLVDGFYYTTDDLVENPDSSVEIDATSLLEQQLQQEVTGLEEGQGSGTGSGSREAFDESSTEEGYDAVSYSKTFPWAVLALILAVLVIAAIVAYFVGRRKLRERRLRKILALPARAQVEQLYLFMLERLRRLGFCLATGATLAEFTASSERQMDMLTEETRVSFALLTQKYQECAYGEGGPSEDDIAPFVAYYQTFWKAARMQLGNFKYFFKSFRL